MLRRSSSTLQIDPRNPISTCLKAADLRFPNQVTEGAVSRKPEATLRREVLPSLWQILRECRMTVDTTSLCTVLLSKLQLCILMAEETLAPYVWLAACVGTISENVVTAVTSSGHLCPWHAVYFFSLLWTPLPWSSQAFHASPAYPVPHLLSGSLLPGPPLGRFLDRISQCASHYHTM